MDGKTAFVNFLSGDYSIDAWSDWAIEQAIELGNALSPSDWEALRLTWASLPTVAQTRLAEVSSGVSIEKALVCKMLVTMLASGSTDVVEASLDSLNSIGDSSPDLLKRLGVEDALKGIAPGGKIMSIIYHDLKKKIESK